MNVSSLLEERKEYIACYAVYAYSDVAVVQGATLSASRYRRPASGNALLSCVVSDAKRQLARQVHRDAWQDAQFARDARRARAPVMPLQSPVRILQSRAVHAATVAASPERRVARPDGGVAAAAAASPYASLLSARTCAKKRQRRVLVYDAWRRLLTRKRRARARLRAAARRRHARRQVQLRTGKWVLSQCVCMCSCVACRTRDAPERAAPTAVSLWLPSHRTLCSRLRSVSHRITLPSATVHAQAHASLTATRSRVCKGAASAAVAPLCTCVHVRVHVQCKRKCHRMLQRWASALTTARLPSRQPLSRSPPTSLLVDLSHYCVYRIDTALSVSADALDGASASGDVCSGGDDTTACRERQRQHEALARLAVLLNAVPADGDGQLHTGYCVSAPPVAAPPVRSLHRRSSVAVPRYACVRHVHMWADDGSGNGSKCSAHGVSTSHVVPATLIALPRGCDNDDVPSCRRDAALAPMSCVRDSYMLVCPCHVRVPRRAYAHARIALVSQWTPCAATTTVVSAFEWWVRDDNDDNMDIVDTATLSAAAAESATACDTRATLPYAVRQCRALLQRVVAAADAASARAASVRASARPRAAALPRRRLPPSRRGAAPSTHRLLVVPSLPTPATLLSSPSHVCLSRCVWLVLLVSTMQRTQRPQPQQPPQEEQPHARDDGALSCRRACRRTCASNVPLKRTHFRHAGRLFRAMARYAGAAPRDRAHYADASDATHDDHNTRVDTHGRSRRHDEDATAAATDTVTRRSSSRAACRRVCGTHRGRGCRIIGLRERAALLRQLCRPSYPADYTAAAGTCRRATTAPLARVLHCYGTLSNATWRVCVRARHASRRLPRAHARRGAWLLYICRTRRCHLPTHHSDCSSSTRSTKHNRDNDDDDEHAHMSCTVVRVGVVTSSAYFAARLGCRVAPVWCLFPPPTPLPQQQQQQLRNKQAAVQASLQPWDAVRRAVHSHYDRQHHHNNRNDADDDEAAWFCLCTRRDAQQLRRLCTDTTTTTTTAVTRKRPRSDDDDDGGATTCVDARDVRCRRHARLVAALADAQRCTPVEVLALRL